VHVVGQPAEQRATQRLALGQRRRQILSGVTEHRYRSDGDDIRRGRRGTQDGKLAEGLAGAEAQNTLALVVRADHDLDLAGKDHPKPVFEVALANDGPTRLELDPFAESGEVIEGLIVDPGAGTAVRRHRPSVARHCRGRQMPCKDVRQDDGFLDRVPVISHDMTT